ncbi:hypothetical protein C2845_PM14G18650 [Panicum miliaceum]|uniref:Uncharacterized protein n=1 Tax=Panicum miliaceum TaxID=4540 RepID=A0A3L6PP22_PANMI|nr:hypothetical protein C2845_PM14G18650 [Panicum miliaceum]
MGPCGGGGARDVDARGVGRVARVAVRHGTPSTPCPCRTSAAATRSGPTYVAARAASYVHSTVCPWITLRFLAAGE